MTKGRTHTSGTGTLGTDKASKVILLDLDDTLYAYAPAHAAAAAAANALLAQKLALPAERIAQAYAAGRKRVHTQLAGTASSHNRLLYYQLALEELGCPPFPLALQAYRAYWGTFLAAMQPFAGMYEALARWRTQGHRICILTDLTADVQFEKIAALRLAQYIDALVTSEEAGCEKPQAAIFDYALAKMNANAADAVMIGDNWDKDILGAHALSIPAWWRAPTDTPLPQVSTAGAEIHRWHHFNQITIAH